MKRSANKEINDGWFWGLPERVMEMTGVSRPTVHMVLRAGKSETEKQDKVIAAALQLVREREERLKQRL